MNSSIFTVWSYNVNVAIMGILALLPDAAPASYHLVMADAGLQVRVGTKYPNTTPWTRDVKGGRLKSH